VQVSVGSQTSTLIPVLLLSSVPPSSEDDDNVMGPPVVSVPALEVDSPALAVGDVASSDPSDEPALELVGAIPPLVVVPGSVSPSAPDGVKQPPTPAQARRAAIAVGTELRKPQDITSVDRRRGPSITKINAPDSERLARLDAIARADAVPQE
jgi:hypothetical protein